MSSPRLAVPFHLLLMLVILGLLVFGAVVSAQEADPHSTTADFTIPLQNITQVKAGGIHTCALSTDGEVTCWGYNEQGQVGSGTTMTSSLPIEVSGLTEGIQFLAPGMFHTCIANTENAYCWGLDDHGQLGNGDKGDSLTPVKVIGLNDVILDIDSGQAHTCVLTDTGGVQCWGANNIHQLGDGTTIDGTTPVDVIGLSSGVTDITVGENHACALLNTGEVLCWGYNGQGAVGDGSRDTHSSPVPVVGLGAKALQITAAGFHTCALLETGAVQCWGDNQHGELGDGTMTNRLTPVTVQGLAGEVKAIVAGAFHTCALMATGDVTCWGQNRYGQLGDGTKIDKLTPTPVLGLEEQVLGITGGDDFTCVVTVSGGVKCWGANFVRQLGDGTTTDQTTPVDVLISMALEESLFFPTIFK
jgi:alpha-tubulin suppressor-like RCC1 family protein